MTNQERETIIRRSAADRSFDVWNDVPRDINRLRKSAQAFGCQVEELPSGAIRVRELPLRAITFRASAKPRIRNDNLAQWRNSRSETEKTGDFEEDDE